MLSPMTQFLLNLQDPVSSGASQAALAVPPAPPIMRLLETTSYQHPRRSAMKPGEEDHWTFSCCGTPGASLADAYAGTLADLDAPDDVLFPAGFLKVTFLLQFSGYVPYRRAKNVQRVKRGVALPTLRRRVVECVAEAVALFIQQAVDTRPRGSSVVFGAGGVELRDLYLLGLHRYGRTLVPMLGFVQSTGGRELSWHEIPHGYAPVFPWVTDADHIQETAESTSCDDV
ncbi:hypothetical protein PsYK624_115060 [Phanerochaete sordida]|uniref:Uncharacterized protein n=1 Tax=Phanerochaete sordida TaxID=48140 RepID=A0A9P3LIM4_9APHY|nr:hypothetical protein PsYK624_115060 [Phanerochaete sordida]